jgi:hypothetical protein
MNIARQRGHTSPSKSVTHCIKCAAPLNFFDFLVFLFNDTVIEQYENG